MASARLKDSSLFVRSIIALLFSGADAVGLIRIPVDSDPTTVIGWDEVKVVFENRLPHDSAVAGVEVLVVARSLSGLSTNNRSSVQRESIAASAQ